MISSVVGPHPVFWFWLAFPVPHLRLTSLARRGCILVVRRLEHCYPGAHTIMSNVQPTAHGVCAVIPMLVCRDAASEIEFCKTAFGAVELSRRPSPDGTVVHATLTIGEGMIMVHGEFPNLASRAPQSDSSSPVVIYLYVEDVDTVIDRAVTAGAKVLLPATNAFWGD